MARGKNPRSPASPRTSRAMRPADYPRGYGDDRVQEEVTSLMGGMPGIDVSCGTGPARKSATTADATSTS